MQQICDPTVSTNFYAEGAVSVRTKTLFLPLRNLRLNLAVS